jgi:ATP-dependent RNA helicase DDX19/DBP5
VSDEIKNLI